MSHVATRGRGGGEKKKKLFSYFFKMCFYSSAKVPTPSLRKHIRKCGCVHVIFLDGERQKAAEGQGGGAPLAVKFYVMFTCQSKGPSEMKAVIRAGSRDFSCPRR